MEDRAPSPILLSLRDRGCVAVFFRAQIDRSRFGTDYARIALILKTNAVIVVLLCAVGFPARAASSAFTNFVNFETAPVHPIALSPDHSKLAVCNLPDGRVELFESEGLTHLASISVGIDPVAVRFRSINELWVVNHISDSINVINVETRAITRVISTRDGPADVVFAGNPTRAFVSCPPENLLLVIDPETGDILQSLPIPGERPRALAVSPDAKKVYAAIFESGNGTTIIAPRMTDLSQFPTGNPVDFFIGPHGGLNPPPNFGANLLQLINTNIPASNPPPRASLIVKKQRDGRWLDDNNGDWTSFVSGTNAAFSGRVPGWDLLDHDVAVIDAQNLEMSFVDSLMNSCMDVAVNPVSGVLAVIGTEALNHVRFEPVLQSVFIRAHLALIDSSSPNPPVILDLNPHLDYLKRSLPPAERRRALGDPRGALWNAAGTRLYVTGMGSDNLAMFDSEGRRLREAPLPAGPTGMALDPERNRLFVLNRFAGTISVLDGDTLEVLQSVSMFDPTPPEIRKGRAHFYNTQKTSGLGQAACASCHLDGRFNRLAWDLGSPTGDIKQITPLDHNFGAFPASVTNHFHPMKGPMVTQTLQDIIGHEPFHWRGDRNGLEEFNPTFTDLQGADNELTDAEMQEFEDFLGTLAFPPNRFRQFDNSLPRSLPLPGHFTLGRGQRDKGVQLPSGDALAGLNFFRASSCRQCHSLPSGMGADKVFRNGRWTEIPPGPSGERHVALSVTERSDDLPFKVAQLRNLPDKVGLNFNGLAQSGFGFFHDGRVDTLTRFLQDGFLLTDDQQTADVAAFLLSFAGSDLPSVSAITDRNSAPSGPSRDVPASVGRQLLLLAASSELTTFINRADSPTGRVELVVKGWINRQPRGWFYDRSGRRFVPDTKTLPPLTQSELFAAKEEETSLLFTLVPAGTGKRLGIDRDLDSVLDFDETNATPTAPPAIVRAVSQGGRLTLIHDAEAGRSYRILAKEHLEADWVPLETITATAILATNTLPFDISGPRRFFMIEVRP
jgi:YVTN family beta-propeller protein